MKVLRQQDTMDCGLACLWMIAKHYGKDLNRNELLKPCDLGKGGASLLGLSKAAEKIGLKTFGGRSSFETLSTERPFPCIAHWKQNHFIVVYKIKKHYNGHYTIYVADPGKGIVTYTKEEFCEHWISTKTNGEEKGIVLLLEPTMQFYDQKGAERISTQSRFIFLWSYLKKYKRFFSQLILGLLLGSLLQLLFPFLTQSIVDNGVGGKDISFVWLVLLAQMMLLFSLQLLISSVRRYFCTSLHASISLLFQTSSSS